jgi:pyruvate/2-oxoglutarate dehydrogenase complex dihydrolipoamide dehydrogenase (E3) component
MERVDVVIIGSGQGGVPLASDWAGEGKKVVLFERSRMGGSCVNWGCTPSKAFLGAAHAAGRVRDAERLGIHANIQVDFPGVMNRVRGVRDSFTESSQTRLARAGVRVVRAEASFTPEGDVTGGEEVYSAPVIVIDTGSSPLIPPVPGLEGTPYLTDRNFWDLEQLPERTLVLGAGYIGLELGQGLARLGSRVQIIDSGERPLERETPSVGAVLKEALERDGVTFLLKKKAEHVAYSDNLFRVQLQGGETLEGDALLVATGRKPNTDALHAPAAGIDLDKRGMIRVDNHFETSRPGVYAIGESAGQPPFTHVSWEDYRRLWALLHGRERTRDDRVLGYGVFTEPQVGRAGLSLEQAKEKGFKAGEVRMEIKEMARAVEWGHELGFYQMIAEKESGRILGATLVGYEAAELVHLFIDLIEAGATWEVLEGKQFIHPTYAENLPSLARLFAP